MNNSHIETASNELLQKWLEESHIKEDGLNQRMGDLDKLEKSFRKIIQYKKKPLAKAISTIMKNRNDIINELSKRKAND